jgi:hypothetical protein
MLCNMVKFPVDVNRSYADIKCIFLINLLYINRTKLACRTSIHTLNAFLWLKFTGPLNQLLNHYTARTRCSRSLPLFSYPTTRAAVCPIAVVSCTLRHTQSISIGNFNSLLGYCVSLDAATLFAYVHACCRGNFSVIRANTAADITNCYISP